MKELWIRIIACMVLITFVTALNYVGCGGGSSSGSSFAGSANSVTSEMIVDNTIVNADISASAAIAGSKLASDGSVIKSLVAGSNITVANNNNGSWTINASEGGSPPPDTYVIYIDNLTSALTWTTGTLKKVPISGGTPTTIDTYVMNWEFNSDRTKVVYLSDTTDLGLGTLKSVPVSGGTPTTLATNVRDWVISPDGTKIFCIANYNFSTYYGDLITIPISGGSPTTLVSGGYSLRVKQDITNDWGY
ncbi:MAG: hypothetical protein V1709_05645 [Planctomycetota bacterium]